MVKSTRVLLLAATSCFCLTTVYAATIYDDFSKKWTGMEFGYGAVATRVRSRLEFNLSPAGVGDTSAGIFGAGLASTCALIGDFDLRVSYRLLKWPAGNGVRVALSLGTPADIEDQKGIRIERGSYSTVEGGPREIYGFVVDGTSHEADTSDTSGRLRLVRVGSRVSGYYLEDTHWIRLSTTESGTEALRFTVLAQGHESGTATEFVSAAFDNVILATGSLQGATCPLAGSQ